jgi:hypothetical protein
MRGAVRRDFDPEAVRESSSAANGAQPSVSFASFGIAIARQIRA